MWYEKLLSGIFGKTGEAIIAYKTEKKRLKFEVKLETLRGKIAYEKAKSDRAERSEGRDATWESESIANSGWKDELVIIVLTIPLVLVFVPPMTQYILDGFRVLQETPDWYRWLVVMIYAATFGIRVWRRKI
jgi:hypothetical protein